MCLVASTAQSVLSPPWAQLSPSPSSPHPRMMNGYSRLSVAASFPLLPPHLFIIGALWKLVWHWACLSNALEFFFWLLSLFYLNLKSTVLARGSYHLSAIRRLKFCSTCFSAAPGPPFSHQGKHKTHATCHLVTTSSFQDEE